LKGKDASATDQHAATRPNGGLRLSEFSIRYPVTIGMILLSFLVLGAVSIARIPLVLTPDIHFPVIVVIVPYHNATPEQVQEAIVKPLEDVLSTIPRVERITSTANADQALIQLQFDWGEDIEWLRAEVREKVDHARQDLPDDVDHILVQTWGTNDIPIIEGRISSGRDLRNAYDFLDAKIKKPLERIPGVADVKIDGVERKEIDIFLRLDDLRRYHVDAGALFRRLDSANLNVSLGRIDDGGYRFSVLTEGALDSLNELRTFPVNDRGLRLGDIADIAFHDPPLNYGRHLNGEYAIGLEIRKASDANTVETVKRVMARIEELNHDPSLEGIDVLVWHNSGQEITKALSGLLNAGILGALLAVGVLFLFLRKLSATLVIGWAIPFSIVAAVGFLYLLGKTLNVLSMMGLMLSTGMLVDNAVVVLESIYQRLERGFDRLTAARTGTQDVIMAVTAATLTTIIIFVPLVFGKKTNLSIWLADTGAAIIITLLCSLFISLTLIPLAVARFLHIDVHDRSRWMSRLIDSANPATLWLKRHFRRGGEHSAETRSTTGDHPSPPRRALTGAYLRLMGWTLQHRALTVIFIVVIVAASALPFSHLADNAPEAQDLQDLTIQYEFSENYHYAKIERDYVNPVEAFLFENKERFKIKHVYSWYTNNEATTRVYFDEDRITLEELRVIRREIARGLPTIPGAEIKLGRQEGATSENWIGVSLYGEDPTILHALAREAKKRLRQKPLFDEIHTDLDRGRQEVQITLDRYLTRRYNLSPQSVAGTLDVVLRGRKLRGYRTPEGEIDIWVKLRPEDREDLDDLKSIVIGQGPRGQEMRLSQVARFHLARAPGSIRREDHRTFASLWINYAGEKKDEGMKHVTDVMNSLAYPPGYGWSFGFWTKRQQKEDQEFIFNLLMALFMVYFVMASLFESLAHPFAIMFSLPFAFVGIAWFLFLTGTPFNIMAQIGVLILVGIVVNNGIVLLDHVNNLRRRGMSRTEAILAGCRERFRPILMTASTTIVGLTPLAIGTSGIFGLRYFPMARTVMGGLMASTVLTLIVLPTLYTLIDDFASWLKRVWLASASPQARRSAEDPAYGD